MCLCNKLQMLLAQNWVTMAKPLTKNYRFSNSDMPICFSSCNANSDHKNLKILISGIKKSMHICGKFEINEGWIEFCLWIDWQNFVWLTKTFWHACYIGAHSRRHFESMTLGMYSGGTLRKCWFCWYTMAWFHVGFNNGYLFGLTVNCLDITVQLKV